MSAQNPPPKANFLFLIAILLTFWMLFSAYNNANKPPAETAPPAATPAPPDAGEAPASADGPESDEFKVTGETVVEMSSRPVAVPGKETPRRGFTARFTNKGAAMRSYRLDDYYRTYDRREPGNEVVILDHVAPGAPSSLLLESITVAKSIAGTAPPEYLLSNALYRITKVPSGARRVAPDGTLAEDWPDLPPEAVGGDVLEMRARAAGFEIVRQYVFAPADDESGLFGFTTTVEIVNRTEMSPYVSCRLWGPAGLLPDDAGYFGRVEAMSASPGTPGGTDVDVKRWDLSELAKNNRSVNGVMEFGLADDRATLAWQGVKNRFFTAILATEDPRALTGGGWLAALPTDFNYWSPAPEVRKILTESKIGTPPAPGMASTPAVAGAMLSPSRLESPLAPGESWKQTYRFYAGPVKETALAVADPRMDAAVRYSYFSWFEPISRLFVWILNLLHNVVGNYGVAIILLTFIIKTCLHPLAKKMYMSAQGMQRIAPLLKELRVKYADDRQKMGMEQMRIYKENNVSMAGGCLPAFVQLPIFIALYGTFSQHFDVRQAMFIPGWIVDLSQPDCVWDWGMKLPLVGWTCLSLLPLIYLVMQITQMRMQPKNPDPQVAQQQKIMQFMPVMFVFIFYTMPSGLVLYFTVSSLYSVIESVLLRRKYPPPPPIDPEAPAAPALDSHGKALAGVGMSVGKSHKHGHKHKK